MATAEDSLSAVLTMLILFVGWIRAFAVSRDVTFGEVQDASYWWLIWIALKMMIPYLEIWLVVLGGLMALTIVDTIFVVAAGIRPDGMITMGDGYATLVYMSAFWDARVVLAIFTTMAVVMGSSIAFLYYMKVQVRAHRYESVLRNGLVLIQVFGICLGLSLLVMQGFFVQ